MKKKRRPQKVNISSAASIQMNRNRAKKVWDALAPIDKHPYDTFEKFFKTKDWKTPERIDSSLKDSDYNLFAQDGKVIHLFGQNFDLKSYKKTWVPSMYKIFQEENKNTEFKNYPLKIATESFGKYWNSESLYPRSRNAFIDEFFDDRDPKGLEGIWNEPHWGIIGIVKKGSVYQRYNIKITTFDKKLFKGGFFDEEKGKNIEGFEIDGTSDGAFIPTNNKRKFKLDGRNISFIPSSDGYVVPINEIVTATVNVVNDNLYYIRPPYGDQEFKGERVWPGGKVASDDTMSAPSSGTAFFVDNSGHIINIGSTAGKEVYPNGNVYCASKHALLGFSRALHDEWKEYGVTVHCISPGTIDTDMADGLTQDKSTYITVEEFSELVYDTSRYNGNMIVEEVRAVRRILR